MNSKWIIKMAEEKEQLDLKAHLHSGVRILEKIFFTKVFGSGDGFKRTVGLRWVFLQS